MKPENHQSEAWKMTIADLIECLSEKPKQMQIDSFQVVWLDKRGMPCKIESPKKELNSQKLSS